jgi:hypothetical protein
MQVVGKPLRSGRGGVGGDVGAARLLAGAGQSTP